MSTKPSSVIKSAIADDADLIVEFNSGKSYRYAGAGHLLSDMESAPSQGAFLNNKVKPNFQASEF
jgi:hypothetical protein